MINSVIEEMLNLGEKSMLDALKFMPKPSRDNCRACYTEARRELNHLQTRAVGCDIAEARIEKLEKALRKSGVTFEGVEQEEKT